MIRVPFQMGEIILMTEDLVWKRKRMKIQGFPY